MVRKSKNSLVLVCLFIICVICLSGTTLRADANAEITVITESQIDSGDTAWILISAALVMLMTPGLAFFYGGLVRRKNILSVLMQCLMILCIVSLQWVLLGYSLSFGPDKYSIIGGLEWLGLKGVGAIPNAEYASTIPHQLFMMYQMMFAVITPALIIGAFIATHIVGAAKGATWSLLDWLKYKKADAPWFDSRLY